MARLIPAQLTHTELAEVIEDMLQRVISGDCLEGSVQFTIPVDEKMIDEGLFDVVASYRTGNLRGQGGVRIISGKEPGDET